MFLVRNGRDSFYAPALSRDLRYRYDPGCMTPFDARAREVSRLWVPMCVLNARRA
jgi:hypothetical protein